MKTALMRSALAAPVLLLAACSTLPAPQIGAPETGRPPGSFSHARFDALLGRFVDEQGRVDYTALAGQPADLDAYYAAIAAVSPENRPELFPDDDARLAYWINAYNASVIALVIDHYPIDSVKDVRARGLFFLPKLSGFFLLEGVVLGEDRTNLYDLEHRLIRKRFADPRIHFALNCASISCPRLPARAFRSDRLQDDLEAEALRFVQEERNVHIDPEDGEITLSAIFDWYADDFTDWMEATHPERPATLLGYIEPYLSPEQAADLARCSACEIRFAEYDWGLNDQPPAGREN